jgi:hypothetical protein
VSETGKLSDRRIKPNQIQSANSWNLDGLRDALRSRIANLAIELLGQPNKNLSSRRELRWGAKGSKRVIISGPRKGACADFERRMDQGDPIGLIQHVHGYSFPEVIAWASAWVGIDVGANVTPETTEQRQKRLARRERERTKARAQAADDEAAIAKARAIAAGAVFPMPEGSPAWLFQLRERGNVPPPGGFGSDIGWHPIQRALVSVLRSKSGAITAVQLTPLTPDGRKRRPVGGVARKTVGRLTTLEGRSVLRLPAHGGAEAPTLIHAEGLETGISGWSSYGAETWIYCGSAMEPQSDRFNIILADDDAVESDVAKRRRQNVGAWTAAGIHYVIATPWETPRGDKSDFNDLIRAGGPQAVQERIEVAIASDPPPARPTANMADVQALVERKVQAWVAGEGPPVILLSTATGSGKTRAARVYLARLVKQRRSARRLFMRAYRRDHPQANAEDVAKAADDAGLRQLRVIYIGPDHGLVDRFLKDAAGLGLTTAHHAGLERNYDPTDPGSPPRCSQPERLKQTRIGGEAIKIAACGIDLNGPCCPDRAGCRGWQSLAECGRAEVVGMVADSATSWTLPRELRDFDYVLVDEPPDRVFFRNDDLKLGLLDDHLFRPHPLYDKAGEPDGATTEDARAGYTRLRAVIEAAPNGYWPLEALREAGCDAGFFDQMVDWTNRRDKPTAMTPVTGDDDRREMARGSFRNGARRLCGLFRLAAGLDCGEQGAGRIEISGQESRIALLRPVGSLHSSLMQARILVTGAKLELNEVQRWLPDAVEVTGPLPRAPHQRAIHFHKGAGKQAMANPARIRWAKALIALEADFSRKGATGVISSLAHEPAFRDESNGVITLHQGALVGRNDQQRCSTLFNFGARSLSPVDAANVGAARTGDTPPVKRARRLCRRAAMRNGGSVLVPTFEFEHPAAQEAQRSVNDFDIMQGPLGRGRGANRTAADPLTLFDVGTHLLPGIELDYLIQSPDQHAPDRFVIMMAESGLGVDSAVDRSKLHPTIYPHPWTAQNDKHLEAGGFVETALRVIAPPWRRGPKEAYVIGRYWPKGPGRRVTGRLFICPARQLEVSTMMLRTRCDADRIEIEREVLPEPEVTINQLTEKDGFIVTSGAVSPEADDRAPLPDPFMLSVPPKASYRTPDS